MPAVLAGFSKHIIDLYIIYLFIWMAPYVQHVTRINWMDGSIESALYCK